MKRIRLQDDDPSIGGIAAGVTLGALAGFVVGIVVAQKVGGFAGLFASIRERFKTLTHRHGDTESSDEEEFEGHGATDEYYDDGESDDDHDDLDSDSAGDEALEESVLRAFRRDALLSERAIDIGAIGVGIIELSGWVETREECDHAMAVTRKVPGIITVVSRLFIGADEEDASDLVEDEIDESAPMPGGVWEGQRVGTGRRRQGNSGEVDRHADPKPVIENKWLDEDHALDEAAGPIEGIAERRRARKGKVADKPASSNGDDSGVPSPG